MPTVSQTDCFYHAMCASAIGDAFGYNVEFDSYTTILDLYGPQGITFSSPNVQWRISDDTQMLLFYWDACAQEHPDATVHQHFLWWLHTQSRPFARTKREAFPSSRLMDFESLYVRRAPGNTCLSALRTGKAGSIEQPINNSKGCGGIMRTLPASYYSQSLEDAFEKGARQAAITHGHPSGYLSAGAYSAICHALLYGASWESALEHTLAVLSHYQGHEETLVACQKATMALQEELIGPDLTEYLGEGWVGEEALAVALYCAKRSHSFEQCVQWATNHSGDSDSTAMLAASLFAILHPLDTSYLRWMHHLDVFPVLEHSKAWLAPLSPSSSC